jgi:hypothetical protein
MDACGGRVFWSADRKQEIAGEFDFYSYRVKSCRAYPFNTGCASNTFFNHSFKFYSSFYNQALIMHLIINPLAYKKLLQKLIKKIMLYKLQ